MVLSLNLIAAFLLIVICIAAVFMIFNIEARRQDAYARAKKQLPIRRPTIIDPKHPEWGPRVNWGPDGVWDPGISLLAPVAIEGRKAEDELRKAKKETLRQAMEILGQPIDDKLLEDDEDEYPGFWTWWSNPGG